MSRTRMSAGILLFRRRAAVLEVFLAHPGGPFWARRDDGVWTVPKGLVDPGEEPLSAARREFEEETGFPIDGEFLSLGAIRMKSGKSVAVWAVAGDVDAAAIRSNTVAIEWPPRSGRVREYPEVDRCAWFDVPSARRKLHPAQQPLLDRLLEVVGASGSGGAGRSQGGGHGELAGPGANGP